MASYGRVLLSHFPCEAPFPGFAWPDGSPRPSLKGMILEGFVSLSVAEIVASKDAQQVLEEQAPPQLLRRVSYIDRTESDKKHASFVAPIAAELGITLEPHRAVRNAPDQVSPALVLALDVVHLVLQDFFVGLDHRVQVHLPHRETSRAVAVLREGLRSAENRARLAALEGVLNLYTDESVASLSPKDLHASAVVGAFAEMLRDDLYHSLAAQAYGLGIPIRAKAALAAMKDAVRGILGRSAVRHLFDLGSKGIAVATHLPIPDSSQTADLLGDEAYLPPLVDIYSVIDRAHKTFQTSPRRTSVAPNNRVELTKPASARNSGLRNSFGC